MPELSMYRERQWEYLSRITQAITARLDLSKVLEMVLGYAVEIVQGRAGLVALRRQDDVLSFVASYGIDPDVVPQFEPLLDDVPMEVREAGSGRWTIPRLEVKLAAIDAETTIELQHVIALPLVVRERLVGILYIFRSPETSFFSPLDKEILSGFADHAAIAIENARLYGKMSQRVDELGSLYQAALALAGTVDLGDVLKTSAEQACAVGASDGSRIFLYDSESGDLTLGAVAGQIAQDQLDGELQEPDGICYEALRDNRWIRVADSWDDPGVGDWAIESGFRSCLAVPLRGEEKSIGVVQIAHQDPGAYTGDHVRMLSTFAHHAATAIQKAQFLGELRAEKQQLDTIIQGSADGIMILDQEGRIRHFNPAFQQLTGWSESNALGQPFDQVLRMRDDQGETVSLPTPSQLAGDNPHPDSIQGYTQTRHGERGRFIHVNFAPLHGEEGRIFSIVVNAADITAFKEAETAKSTFLAGISHELKTPISLILGYAETLSRTDVEWDDEILQESLEVIQEEAQHLNHLVEDALDAARIESVGLSLKPQELRVDELAEKVVSERQTVDHDHHWAIDIPDDFPEVRADGERIRQVLHNLLSNAVKYAPEGGLIRVGGWVEEEKIGIYVEDEGPGVPLELQSRIFDRFTRGDTDQVRQAEGAGLGLYLAKVIVEEHGGHIWVESSPGKGATFYFTLPRSLDQED